jgi:hypothetical protein
MTKKRTSSHVIGEYAEHLVRGWFLCGGWVVQSCTPDYGFDFEVHPCRGHEVLPITAYVQVKGVSRRLTTLPGGAVSYRIETEDLRLWLQEPTPSYLCVVQLPAEIASPHRARYIIDDVQVPRTDAFLCNTWHLIDDLEAREGRDWFRPGGLRLVHLPAESVWTKDRLGLIAHSLDQRWSKMADALLVDGERMPSGANMAKEPTDMAKGPTRMAEEGKAMAKEIYSSRGWLSSLLAKLCGR